MSSNEALTLRLKAGREQRLLRGHRWVFSNELEEVPRDAEPGTLAALTSARGRLMGVGFFNPRSLIAFRLVARDAVRVDAEFLRRRLEEAAEYRARMGAGDYHRLCAGEADGLPGLVVDRYGDHLVLEISAAGIEARRAQLLEALQAFEPKSVFARNDLPLRDFEGLPRADEVLSGRPPEDLGVDEGDVRYFASPRAGLPFPFLQRDHRARFADAFKHKSVLDVCCGLGGFGLAAAARGAARVYGVDAAPEAIKLAGRAAGKLPSKGQVQFEAADPEQALEVYATTKGGLPPDYVFLTPPSPAPTKKQAGRAERRLLKLNTLALRALKHGGILATTAATPHIAPDAFVEILRKAAAKAGKTVRLREVSGQAADHPVLLAMPETRVLSFAVLEVV